LFAGVGGFTLGVQGSNLFHTALLVDSDASAAATFKRNRPTVPYWVKDLSGVEPDQLLDLIDAKVGDIDLLTAGPPCQGFSKIGLRQLDDPRNQLLRHTAELVEGLQPKLAVVENVPPVSWDGHSALFDELSDTLDIAGYETYAEVLEAWRFGVPQLRRRLFIVALRRDLALEADTLLPQGDDRDEFKARELIRAADLGEPQCPPGLSVAEAIGDLPALKAGAGDEVAQYTDDPQTPYQRARRENATLLLNHRARAHSSEMLAKVRMITEGGRNFELPDGDRLRAEDREYFSQAYGRLHRHGIAQTITTYFHNPGSGRFIHYQDDRSITVREAARFQSFDDDFMFLGHAEWQMRHVGNAVPVLLGEAIAKRCGEALERLGVTPAEVPDVA
jgi:DNA (cytosine-5)-methyltransferase 1